MSDEADVERVDARRSLGLMSCGALAGLALAGYALFTARGTSTLRVPPEDVALVNQQPISRSDFLLELQALYSEDMEHTSRAERKKVLQDMIREELFVQRGKELDVAATSPEVRAALVSAVELEAAADAITSQPTEAQLRAYYKNHQAQYASEGIMTVHDCVFPSGAEGPAREAAHAMRSMPPTAGLLARFQGKESGKAGNEEFYFAARIHIGNRLFEAARALGDGDVSAPIELPDGIHVLYMTRNQKPVPFGYPEARDRVLVDYRNESIDRTKAGDEAFLRKRANILIADDMR